MKNIIYLQVHTQFTNTGDALINNLLIKHLRLHGKVFVNNKDIPEFFLNELDIRNTEKTNSSTFVFVFMIFWRAFLSLFFNSKVYLVSGPGHLFGNSLFRAFKTCAAGVLYFFFRILRVKLLKIGVSIGDIGWRVAESERFRSFFIENYLVRDFSSLNRCQIIGLKNFAFFPDLAWSFKAFNCLKESEIRGNARVLISFRSEGFDEDQFIQKILSFIIILKDIIKQTNQDCQFQVVYQVDKDFDFCLKLYSILQKDFQVDFDYEKINLQNTHVRYSNVSYVISNRLHVLLLGACFGAIPLALIKMRGFEKISAIFNDNLLQELLFYLEDDVEQIHHNLDRINNHRLDIVNVIENAFKDNSDLSFKILNRIFIDGDSLI